MHNELDNEAQAAKQTLNAAVARFANTSNNFQKNKFVPANQQTPQKMQIGKLGSLPTLGGSTSPQTNYSDKINAMFENRYQSQPVKFGGYQADYIPLEDLPPIEPASYTASQNVGQNSTSGASSETPPSERTTFLNDIPPVPNTTQTTPVLKIGISNDVIIPKNRTQNTNFDLGKIVSGLSNSNDSMKAIGKDVALKALKDMKHNFHLQKALKNMPKDNFYTEKLQKGLEDILKGSTGNLEGALLARRIATKVSPLLSALDILEQINHEGLKQGLLSSVPSILISTIIFESSFPIWATIGGGIAAGIAVDKFIDYIFELRKNNQNKYSC